MNYRQYRNHFAKVILCRGNVSFTFDVISKSIDVHSILLFPDSGNRLIFHNIHRRHWRVQIPISMLSQDDIFQYTSRFITMFKASGWWKVGRISHNKINPLWTDSLTLNHFWRYVSPITRPPMMDIWFLTCFTYTKLISLLVNIIST